MEILQTPGGVLALGAALGMVLLGAAALVAASKWRCSQPFRELYHAAEKRKGELEGELSRCFRSWTVTVVDLARGTAVPQSSGEVAAEPEEQILLQLRDLIALAPTDRRNEHLAYLQSMLTAERMEAIMLESGLTVSELMDFLRDQRLQDPRLAGLAGIIQHTIEQYSPRPQGYSHRA